MSIKLDDEDRKKLVELYERAQTTPYLVFGPNGENTADSAWREVSARMDELGLKYGFDPRKMKGIDKDTGEIRL